MSSLLRGKRSVGTWTTIDSPILAEMAGLAGFDFTIIDTEHTHFGLETAVDLVRACAAYGVQPWIRAPKVDRHFIGRAFDCGAAVVLVPSVGTAEEARESVGASRFAPEGQRGACPSTRAGGHVTADWVAHTRRQAAETGVVLLIETVQGYRSIESILEVEGIAGIMVGAFDLSVSMGFEGEAGHPEVQAAVASIMKLAAAKGVPVVHAMGATDAEASAQEVAHYGALGATHFAATNDKLAIALNYRWAAEAARQAVAKLAQGV